MTEGRRFWWGIACAVLLLAATVALYRISTVPDPPATPPSVFWTRADDPAGQMYDAPDGAPIHSCFCRDPSSDDGGTWYACSDVPIRRYLLDWLGVRDPNVYWVVAVVEEAEPGEGAKASGWVRWVMAGDHLR